MRLIINPVNILVFSISRNLVFIHSYIISADGFYIIVDQSFHIVKLHSQTVLLPYDNSVRSLVYSHACAAVHADRFVYVIFTDYRFFTLVVRMLAPFKVKLVRIFVLKFLFQAACL